jgi:hypothetical protein
MTAAARSDRNAIDPAAPEPGLALAAPGAPPETIARSPEDSLKDFLKENATLIFLIGSMTSLSSFVVNLPLGWLDSYLKAVLLAAALLLWMELHAQWPHDVRFPERVVHPRIGTRRPWRLALFALLMQATVVLFAVWSVVTAPEVIVPLLAAAGGWLAARRLIPRGRAGAVAAAAVMVVAFLLSEAALERIFPHKATLLDQFAADIEDAVEE